MQTNNKYRLNIERMIFSLLIVLFFAGCSKDDNDIDNGMGENAIAFDCSTSNLRAAKAVTDDMQYFRVSAIWEKETGVYEPFMTNQLVEKQGDSWVYSPIRYFPGYGSVSFFAYSPATPSGVDPELININNSANQITIQYNVSTNYQQQEDFLVATSLDRRESPVKLKFQHALSSVVFQACSNEPNVAFRINEIKLINLFSTGLITGVAAGETSTWLWYEHLVPQNYVVYQKYPFETQCGDYKEVGGLMVLPQKMVYPIEKPVNNFEIVVSYEKVGTPNSETKGRYTLDDDFVFEMGKKYTFNLSLGTKPSSRSSRQAIDLTKTEIKWHIVCEPNNE
ncbi:fimbrillin family protein [Dysgonomonas sp. 520]|uniref:fimbrillin family protein n=1 Tax=Dysgonomonas sp. 520 TaxID=2302931 RepID=UPI0013D57B01|nr:fimbrillin family protein [Dysgonomonas sp. 520]NDW08361.1 fimbrillin family protein [Dysgonomonas sp. 520]